MKILYLLRHAKAEPGGKTLADMDRPLSGRGREACAVMGAYMKARGYMPAHILCSPSLRTKETVERLSEATSLHRAPQFERKLYLATAEEIINVVQEVEDDVTSVMVVGHNPGMHHAALMLAQPQRTRLRATLELKYPTGSLTVLHFHCESWAHIAPEEAELVNFVTPGESNPHLTSP